jgi:excinuclease UvrABC ATPase subunit
MLLSLLVYIIADIGPEGGKGGGQVVCQRTPVAKKS